MMRMSGCVTFLAAVIDEPGASRASLAKRGLATEAFVAFVDGLGALYKTSDPKKLAVVDVARARIGVAWMASPRVILSHPGLVAVAADLQARIQYAIDERDKVGAASAAASLNRLGGDASSFDAAIRALPEPAPSRPVETNAATAAAPTFDSAIAAYQFAAEQVPLVRADKRSAAIDAVKQAHARALDEAAREAERARAQGRWATAALHHLRFAALGGEAIAPKPAATTARGQALAAIERLAKPSLVWTNAPAALAAQARLPEIGQSFSSGSHARGLWGERVAFPEGDPTLFAM